MKLHRAGRLGNTNKRASAAVAAVVAVVAVDAVSAVVLVVARDRLVFVIAIVEEGKGRAKVYRQCRQTVND